MSSKDIDYVKVVSKDKHEFYIEYTVAKLCGGIWDMLQTANEDKEGVPSIILNEYTKDILEIIIEYLYYKSQNLNADYTTMEKFDIPPHKALGVFKAATNLKI